MNLDDTINAPLDMDALLDGTLDDLADLPTFEAFPVGAHKVIISWQTKDKDGKKPLVINKHPTIQLNLTAIETVELPAGSEDKPLTKGAETSVLFMMDNDMGQGAFKEIMKALAKHYGAESPRVLMEKSEKAECLVVTNKRPNKEKTKMYTGIDALQVL